MDEQYNVIYLPLFYKDLNSIVKYIKYRLQNPIAANNFLNIVEEEIQKRAYNPKGYEEYKSKSKRKQKYYRIYVNNYTVFYTVKDNVMEVRRILSSRRNFDKLI